MNWRVGVWSDGVTVAWLPEDEATYGLGFHEAYHWCVEQARVTDAVTPAWACVQ